VNLKVKKQQFSGAEHKRPQLKTPVIPDALSPEQALCSGYTSCREKDKPQPM